MKRTFLLGVISALVSAGLFVVLATSAHATSPYSQDVLAHGSINLQNYWRIGDSSTSFADSQGGNTATGSGGIVYQSLALLPGDATKAAKFNGSTGYATLATSSAFNFEYTNDWTIEALVDSTAVGSTGAEQFIACKELNSGTYAGWCFGLVNYEGNGLKLEFLLVNQITPSVRQLYVVGSQVISTSTAHHVSVTYTGGGSDGGGQVGDVQFEVDGVIDTGVTSVAPNGNTLAHTSILNAAAATIGSRSGAGGFFNGYIQELAVYTGSTLTGFAPQVFNHWALFNGNASLSGVSSTPSIILDSDFGEDIDDAGDLAVLSQLAVRGETTIAAVINETSIPAGIAAQRVIANYFGATVGSYGAYKGSDLAAGSNYAPQVVTRFGATYAGGSSDTRSNYPDATLVYRSALNAAANNSVTVVMTGEMNAFNNFLNSTADCGNCSATDSIASTGIQLATAKIKRVVMEAGLFPVSSYYNGPYSFSGGVVTNSGGQPEYNFSAHSSASNAGQAVSTLLSNSVPVVFVGDEEGINVFSGPPSGASDLTDPLKYAYDTYASSTGSGNLNGLGQRPAWGQLAVLFAVRGFGSAAAVSPGTYFETYMLDGAMTVNTGTGANTQIGSATGTISNIAVLPGATTTIGAFLNGLMSGISTSITSPSNGATVSGTVSVTATATSTAGIFSVQFYLDGSSLGSVVTSSPYTISWNAASSTVGSHTLYALATDSNNNIATSSSVTVTVISIPVLTITTSTTLAYTSSYGATTTPNQNVVIQNTGPASSTLSWSATSTQSWLTFGASSGSLASNASTSVSFIVNPSGLLAGTQNATATISASGATNSPQNLLVTITVNATTSTPPYNLAATSGNAQVALSWSAPTSTNGSNLTEYDIWDKITASSSYAFVASTSPSLTTSTITSLTNGTNYSFEVFVVNGVGSSSASNVATATPSTIPSAPTIGVATPDNTQVSVAFVPGADGGSAILYYTAISTPGSFSATSSGSPIVVPGLTNGTAYSFVVTATNANGTSASSTPFFAPPVTNPPSIITNVPAGGILVTSSPPSFATATSSPATTTLVAELQLLIAKYQSLARSLGPTQGGYSFQPFTKNLQFLAFNPDVLQLQAYLNDHGFIIAKSGPGSSGHEIERFGPATLLQLKRFQASIGIIPASGYFGPTTRAWVNGHE